MERRLASENEGETAMADTNPELIQAEFLFFISRNTLQKTVRTIMKTGSFGGRSSLVVRLYDERREIAPLIRRYSALHAASGKLVDAMQTYGTGGGRLPKPARKLARLMGQFEETARKAHVEALSLLKRALERAVIEQKPLAFDDVDYSFHAPRANELEQLSTAFERAGAVNLFAFTHADLLARKLENGVASFA